MKKLVSIIIPTFKGNKQLTRAINSVLDQTYENIEILVIDDNIPTSLERKYTEEIMGRYINEKRIKYIKHSQNKNGSAARNTGIFHAKGEYICFLDDDDFYFSNRIERCVEILEKNKLYKGVYCSVAIANQSSVVNIINANKELEKKDILLNEMAIGTGSNIFIRKELVNEVGFFDESFIRHQDLEYMLRVLSVARIINLNEILIVKATNGVYNIPNYIKLKQVKEKYWNKFKEDINSLNESEKKVFYTEQYRTLFYIAFKSKNREWIKEAKKNLQLITNLTVKEYIYIYLVFTNFCDSKLYYKVEKILKKIKDKIKKDSSILLNNDIQQNIIKYLN